MKYMLKLGTDQTGVPIDADTLRRFVDASQADGDAAYALPELARYVGSRLGELLDAEG